MGQCLQELVENQVDDTIDFIFKPSSTLDISNLRAVRKDFSDNDYRYCINCAAYTQVDKAETEVELAKKVNIEGAKNLALACKEIGARLIHISTDFVFDGKASVPYTEANQCNPLSVYGQTKLEGEKAIVNILEDHFIIRTSWLYSEYGNNFMKTMLRLGNERDMLSVIDDQSGTPTYAKDIAEIILRIIALKSTAYGIYHFSNEGTTSWYGFAKKIFEISDVEIDLKPIPTEAYPTPAARPNYSVLDKTKIKGTFGIEILDWEDRLEDALEALGSLTS